MAGESIEFKEIRREWVVDEKTPQAGTIASTDSQSTMLKKGFKEFYANVVGWKPVSFEMNGYADFDMTTPDGETTFSGDLSRAWW